MFPRQPLPPQQPQAPDYGPQFKTLTDHVKGIADTIAVTIKKQGLLGAPIVKEIATLSSAEKTIEMQGYRYFGIIVSGNTTLHVEQDNVRYDVSLAAGFNRLIMLDGANLSTDTATPCVLVRSSYLFE